MKKRYQLSPARQITHYLGLALIAIGVLSCFSVFASIAFSMMQGDMFPDGRTFFARFFAGMILIMIGSGLSILARMGLAGSGLIPDPVQARKDVEPWSRMVGGVLQNVLEETSLAAKPLAGPEPSSSIEERLQQLEALKAQGIITEEEYTEKRRDIIASL